MQSVTDRFVEQVYGISFSSFSEKTVKEAKKALVDTLGCMIAGVRSEIGKATMQVFSSYDGENESSVLGAKRKLPAALAAYINGETCVGPDLSDNYQPESIILSHPGEAVIPPVLALAERRNASLKELLVAIIAGYEMDGRYAWAIEPRKPGVYSFSTHYTLAGAVGCGKILNFDPYKMKKNLGIAGALASLPVTSPMWGFRDRPASWHRDMPGHTSFSAVVASSYAQTSFEGTRRLLDPDVEFYKLAGSDNYDTERLFKNWGEEWVIESITYKQIPSCYFQQTGIEAVRLLVENNGIANSEIKKIDIYQPTHFARNFVEYPPRTSVDTASSLKYLVACYLLDRNISVAWYEKFSDYLKGDDFKSIAEKTEIHMDEDLQKLFEEQNIVKGRAVIETSRGTFQQELRLEELKGNTHNNPMSYEEIEEKFVKLCEPVIGTENALSFLSAINRNDYDVHVQDILRYLA